MSPVIAGIAGIGLLLLLFLLRLPVAFAMALVGLVGFAYLADPGPALSLLAQDIFEQFSSYPLSVIPMFALRDDLYLGRRAPWRPDYGHRACLCRLCCHLWVDRGHGGDNG
jgi:TRAP-type mannitol/chloroaromatic compound transport system permease large subunit